MFFGVSRLTKDASLILRPTASCFFFISLKFGTRVRQLKKGCILGLGSCFQSGSMPFCVCCDGCSGFFTSGPALRLFVFVGGLAVWCCRAGGI